MTIYWDRAIIKKPIEACVWYDSEKDSLLLVSYDGYTSTYEEGEEAVCQVIGADLNYRLSKDREERYTCIGVL